MNNPFVPSSKDSAQPAVENASPKPSQATAPWWVAASLAALVVGLIFTTVQQYQANANILEQIEQTQSMLKQVEERAGTLEADFQAITASTQQTAEQLNQTNKQLSQTAAQGRRLRKTQEESATQLATRLSEHQSQIESISGEVTEVRGAVEETQVSLENTRSELSRAMGDLGVQSGLIARNHEELEELKRRGDRDYIEFDVRKAKQFERVGEMAVRLNKTDTKRNRYTLTVLFNDKNIEKKDKTIYEPVQFYTGQKGQLLELVVFTLDKDRIAGYISLPKNYVAANRATP